MALFDRSSARSGAQSAALVCRAGAFCGGLHQTGAISSGVRPDDGAPVLQGFRHMGGLHTRAVGQVGDGARHLERAVRGAGRPAQAFGSFAGQGLGSIVQLQVLLQCGGFQPLVGVALALQCQVAGLDHAGLYLGAGLGGRSGAAGFAALQQLGRRQGRDFHLQVDAVQQRAAELGVVARHLIGRAAAAGAALEAAGAGVHGGHQLEAGGKVGLLGGAGDLDAPGLQRLAQRLQGRAGELRKFIQKQHAVVGAGDGAGPWR